MLSLFPDLLLYSLNATALLRVSLGLIIFYSGAKILLKGEVPLSAFPQGKILAQAVGLLHAAVGALLIVGYLTQGAAIAGALGSLAGLIAHTNRHHERRFFFLCLVVSLSLIFFGAGYPAFDIPL